MNNNVKSQAGQAFAGSEGQSNYSIDGKCQAILDEFKDSGISPDVFHENCSIVPDIYYDPVTWEPLSTPIADALGFTYRRFYQTRPNPSLAVLFSGYGQKIEEAWQAKIFSFNPIAGEILDQAEHSKDRTGQYLAPKGIGDVPFIPFIPLAIADKIIATHAPDLVNEWEQAKECRVNFWEFFLSHKQIPLIITEGLKKALAIVSNGYPSLALFGYACGVASEVPFTLKPELLPYCEGRPVYIAFDEDSKQSAKSKGKWYTEKLSKAIENSGGYPSIVEWDGSQGKGADDLISKDPNLFHQAVKNALPLVVWQFNKNKDISKYVKLVYNLGLGEYLPSDIPFPKERALIGIQIPKGGGKTESLAKVTSENKALGRKTFMGIHRTQLEKETAKRLGIPHREQVKNGADASLGYALCVDSLHPNANPPVNPSEWRGCDVIIDEATQTLWHLLDSRTCTNNRAAIIETLAEICANANRVFLADADLDLTTIEFFKDLMGDVEVFGISGTVQRQERTMFVYEKAEDLYAAMREHIEQDKTVWGLTGSQKTSSKWGSINLEKNLKKDFPDIAISRMDSESVADPNHPAFGSIENLDYFVNRYQAIVTSPVMETGISYTGGHFDAVFQLATGSQTVGGVGQARERDRSSIPRHIWAIKCSQNKIGNGSISYQTLLKSQDDHFKANLAELGRADLLLDSKEINAKISKTWAKMAAFHNYGYQNYRDLILANAKADGYTLVFVGESSDRDSIKEMVKETKVESHNEYCQKVEAATILDPDDYDVIKDKRQKTEPERLSEKKTALSIRYATDDVTADLVNKDSKTGWYKALLLHYYLTTGKPYLKDNDLRSLDKLSTSEDGKPLPIIATDANRKLLSVAVKVLDMLNVSRFFDPDYTYTADSEMEWFKGLAKYRQAIRDSLGINLNPDDSPCKFINQSLLGLLKLKPVVSRAADGTRTYRLESLDPDGRGDVFVRWEDRDLAKQQSKESEVVQEVVSRPFLKYNENSISGSGYYQSSTLPQIMVGGLVRWEGTTCQVVCEHAGEVWLVSGAGAEINIPIDKFPYQVVCEHTA